LGQCLQTTSCAIRLLELKITHPASAHYNKRLPIVKFRTIDGEKRVILQTPVSGTISVPLSWTDFLMTSSKNKSRSLWADAGHLLDLCKLINLIQDQHLNQNGGIIEEEQKTVRGKRNTDDIIRNSTKKDLADPDTRTTPTDRRDIRSNPLRFGQGGEEL